MTGAIGFARVAPFRSCPGSGVRWWGTGSSRGDGPPQSLPFRQGTAVSPPARSHPPWCQMLRCEQGFSRGEMRWSGCGMPPRRVPPRRGRGQAPRAGRSFPRDLRSSGRERWQTRSRWGAMLGAKSHRVTSLVQGTAVSPVNPSPSPRAGVGAVPWPQAGPAPSPRALFVGQHITRRRPMTREGDFFFLVLLFF